MVPILFRQVVSFVRIDPLNAYITADVIDPANMNIDN